MRTVSLTYRVRQDYLHPEPRKGPRVPNIDKLDFLKAYPAAHQEVFTTENIQSGFRATVLIPFNPKAVLDKLNLNLGTPTPPPSRGGASIPSSQVGTSYNVRHAHLKGSSVKKLFQRRSKSPR
jgi:hypothetical protein